MYSMTTLPSIGVVFITSAFLCRELAKKKHRDTIFYFIAGGLIGPLCILVVMTPLPAGAAGGETATAAEKHLRVVDRPECPACSQKVFPGDFQCAHCGCSLGVPLWERTQLLGDS